MQFIFRAKAELSGVLIFVEAANLDEAKQKAKANDYEGYDLTEAECVNIDINTASGELNE